MTSFPKDLAIFLGLITFTLLLLTSLVVRTEHQNLGDLKSAISETLMTSYNYHVTMQEQEICY